MLLDPPPEPARPPGTTHKWQGKIIGDWSCFLSKKFASGCVWSPPWLSLTCSANRAGMMPLSQGPNFRNGAKGAFKEERGQPCPHGDRSRFWETRGQGCPRSSGEILELTRREGRE